MALKAGTLKKLNVADMLEDNYKGSMAESIEHAFQEEWPYVMDGGKPGANRQMRLFFIAIAQGVVKYLKDHADSFEVEVQGGGSAGIKNGNVSKIQIEGILHSD